MGDRTYEDAKGGARRGPAEFLAMKCARVQRLLDEYVFEGKAGETEHLPPGGPTGCLPAAVPTEGLPAKVREHLASCDSCRKAWEEMLLISSALERAARRAKRDAAPGRRDAALVESVMSKVRSGKAGRPAARRGSMLRELAAIGALVVAAIPVLVPTAILIATDFLRVRPALEVPLYVLGLLARSIAPWVETSGRLIAYGLAGVARAWYAVSSVFLEFDGIPLFVLLFSTLALAYALVRLLSRPGDEQASPTG